MENTIKLEKIFVDELTLLSELKKEKNPNVRLDSIDFFMKMKEVYNTNNNEYLLKILKAKKKFLLTYGNDHTYGVAKKITASMIPQEMEKYTEKVNLGHFYEENYQFIKIVQNVDKNGIISNQEVYTTDEMKAEAKTYLEENGIPVCFITLSDMLMKLLELKIEKLSISKTRMTRKRARK